MVARSPSPPVRRPNCAGRSTGNAPTGCRVVPPRPVQPRPQRGRTRSARRSAGHREPGGFVNGTSAPAVTRPHPPSARLLLHAPARGRPRGAGTGRAARRPPRTPTHSHNLHRRGRRVRAGKHPVVRRIGRYETRPWQARHQAAMGRQHIKAVHAGHGMSAFAAEGDDDGADEAENSAEATAQFTEARTAPGVVAPGAYGAAWQQLQSMKHTNCSWNHVTKKAYNSDDSRYRDVNSNSSGGSGKVTGREVAGHGSGVRVGKLLALVVGRCPWRRSSDMSFRAVFGFCCADGWPSRTGPRQRPSRPSPRRPPGRRLTGTKPARGWAKKPRVPPAEPGLRGRLGAVVAELPVPGYRAARTCAHGSSMSARPSTATTLSSIPAPNQRRTASSSPSSRRTVSTCLA